ncbi:DNA repair protein RecN [Paenibacillus yanchengensis]|uniref:DNA repair protein RecN n=1 Tax=Paenibacillus yanchengensis TaxID=2035833 RepID=A0ABW4YK36_9BACL
MLRELAIKNLAVIEQVDVTFRQGFHVLTGETGAGKSILIDALGLVIGGRGSAEMVRHGCDKAVIEAMFDLSAQHPVWNVLHKIGINAAADEALVIRRELSAAGKSSSRINGQLVTMTMLREVGEFLVNIHGQHEHQSLLKTERHLEWLDLYAGDLLADRKHSYQHIYKQLQQVRAEMKQLEQTTRQSAQMYDLYSFQMEEIQSAALTIGEDEILLEEKQKLMHATKLIDHTNEAYTLLREAGAIDALATALSKLESIMSYDKEMLSPLHEQLSNAYYQAEDASFQLRDYRDNIDVDPQLLIEVDDRIALINSLKRKYGESIAEILQYLQVIQTERDKIENRDAILEQLAKQERQLMDDALRLATELSLLRKHAATELASNIEQELKLLQMPNVKFNVKIDVLTDHDNEIRLNNNGMDEAIFMLSSNPGEPLKPLAKIASGGEMSRIMLALKSIFSEIDQVPVLIFDEVDTGVSGRAAQAIAERMSNLALRCQVFSITHLPQVACMADHHYEIRKQVVQDRTATGVTMLVQEARIEELARMLGGVEVTEKTRNHAQEMLDLAHGLKGA